MNVPIVIQVTVHPKKQAKAKETELVEFLSHHSCSFFKLEKPFSETNKALTSAPKTFHTCWLEYLDSNGTLEYRSLEKEKQIPPITSNS